MRFITAKRFLSIVLLTSGAMLADTATINGYTWSYIVSDGTATIQKKQGSNFVCAVNPAPAGAVEIPATLNGYQVTKIGEKALYRCSDMTYLKMPDTIIDIGSYAFSGCTNMADCVLSKTLQQIHKCAFQDCTALNSITIPYTVNAISRGVFVRSGSSGYAYFTTLKTVIFLGPPPAVVYEDEGDPTFFHNGSQFLWSDILVDAEYLAQWHKNLDLFKHYQYGSYMYGHYYIADDVQAAFVHVHILPDTQNVGENIFVSMQCSDDNAVIHYTIDGSAPTIESPIYSGPFKLPGRVTIRAIAVSPSYPMTVEREQSYAFGQTENPTITSSQGSTFHWSGNSITLASPTDGATIRYTLDGSEPTETSTLYTGPFDISETATVKAKAFKEDWFDSETVSANFTRQWYTVETPPTIAPADGTVFDNVSQTVTISCEAEGATILYTADGSDPAVNGREYKGPFTVYDSCTVRAIARKDDMRDSAEATATLTRGEPLSAAANLYGLTMETDSGSPWTVVTDMSHDGASSVRSGAIANGGMTWLQMSVKKAGTVSFWWRAQCEEPDEEDGEDGYYDYCAFMVDGVLVARLAGNETGWRFFSTDVASGGKHVLRWEYRKDGSASYAPDCAWLDQVQWIPADGSGTTLTSPEQVPYSWLAGFGLGKDGDFEAAAKAPTGKFSSDGKAMFAWQDFVAGTDPTNAASVFTAGIEFVDGVPTVTWSPDLNTNGMVRTYTVWGKADLSDEKWHSPTNAADRFFRVSVEMP